LKIIRRRRIRPGRKNCKLKINKYMAIVIEEDKSGGSLLRMVVWVVILAIIIAAVYYVFFAQPQLIAVTIPPTFQDIAPLANANVDPNAVVGSAAFTALKQYVTPLQPGNAGRSNPFQPL